MTIPAWALSLVAQLAGAIVAIVDASSQAEIDKAFEDAAEAVARAKIQRERETAAGG